MAKAAMMEMPYKTEQKISIGEEQWGYISECPYCGSEKLTLTDYVYPYPDGEVHEVVIDCDNCGAATEDYPNVISAINAWNDREIG